VYWYNPKTREMEDVPDPLLDEQAIEMLSGHPHSNEFIVEYMGLRAMHGIVEALRFTGETFRMIHRAENLPPRSQ
jgi:hypothetical protein